MTSFEKSNHFILGLALLARYRGEGFSINVVENSAVSVEGLNLISKQDLDDLNLLGWDAGNADDKGFATYYKLDYVDY